MSGPEPDPPGAAPLPPPDPLAALLVAVAGGDADAFRQLYDRTAPRLFGVVRRILGDRAQAEEVLQEVYVRVWQAASGFDATRGRPLGWLTALARYRAIDAVRRNAAREAGRRREEPLGELVAEDGLDPAEVDALRRCLSELPPEQRDCVVLAYCDGYSRDELARRFDRPVGTVKSWLSRCLTSLRACLDAYG